jgi:hypothetical protein
MSFKPSHLAPSAFAPDDRKNHGFALDLPTPDIHLKR